MYTFESSCGTFLSVVALHPLNVQCARTRALYVQLQWTICFFNQADTFSSICKVHPKTVHPSSLTLSVGFCMFACLHMSQNYSKQWIILMCGVFLIVLLDLVLLIGPFSGRSKAQGILTCIERVSWWATNYMLIYACLGHRTDCLVHKII
jgi:hypothetical protein